jgi:hypothetical protein
LIFEGEVVLVSEDLVLRGVMAGCISKCHYFGKTNPGGVTKHRPVAGKPRAREVHWQLAAKAGYFAGWRKGTRETEQVIF